MFKWFTPRYTLYFFIRNHFIRNCTLRRKSCLKDKKFFRLYSNSHQSPLVELPITSREYRQQCLTKHNWWDISVPLIHTLTNSFTYSSFFAFRHRLQHLHGRKDFRHSEAKVPMDPTKPFAQISHPGQYQRFQRDNDETSCKSFLFGSHVGYYGWKREDIWVRALLWVKREDIWVRDLLWDIKRGYLGKRFTMGEKERIFR